MDEVSVEDPVTFRILRILRGLPSLVVYTYTIALAPAAPVRPLARFTVDPLGDPETVVQKAVPSLNSTPMASPEAIPVIEFTVREVALEAAAEVRVVMAASLLAQNRALEPSKV
jgi:hypothetical protein